MKLKICFFGSYRQDYSNAILLKGLKYEGVEIVHVFHPNYFTFSHYPSLFWQFIRKARDCDIIFVAFFGHYDVWFAWILAKLFGKKMVFYPLISIYNTRIEDRKYFNKDSLRAKFYIFFDWLNVHLPDKVFLDTATHIDYFIKMFHLEKNKTSIIRVGADEDQLAPISHKRSKPPKILFYGSYQPSQGVAKMIQAAKILKTENLQWIFIGSGQDRLIVEKYAKNNRLSKVKFIESLPFSDLAKYIDAADILLGVFGDTAKTRIVIHNKIFQSLAMGKALITQDTPAVREIIKNGTEAILVEPTPQKIAEAIIKLSANPKKITQLGKNARKLFLANFTSKKVGEQTKIAFESLLKS